MLTKYYPGRHLLNQGIYDVSHMERSTDTDFNEAIRILKDVRDIAMQLQLSAASSRIAAYVKVLEDFKAVVATRTIIRGRQFIELVNTAVEVQELRKIFSAATASTNPHSWKAQLRKLIPGAHPHVNSKMASAWDFQFEMFVAAIAQLSNYQVTFAEPDVLIKEEACVIGIAAKRPRTLGNLKKNLKKAVQQIQSSGFDGLVALDLSYLTGGQRHISGTREGAAITVRYLVDDFIAKHNVEIRATCIREHVMGVLFCLHMPLFMTNVENELEGVASAFRWTLFPLTDDQASVRWILNFANRCRVGLFGSFRPTMQTWLPPALDASSEP